MGYLAAARLVFAGAAIAFSLVSRMRALPSVKDTPILAAALAYLGASLALEGLRRWSGRRGLGLIAGSLLLDATFLTWVAYATGGTRSPLRLLILVHLFAVSLLGAHRTGLKVAAWYSLLFFVSVYAEAAGLLATAPGTVGTLPGHPGFLGSAALNLGVLWMLTISVSAFSSVGERELRRQNAALGQLSAMAAELDGASDAQAVGRIALDHLSAAFGYRQLALLVGHGRELTVLASGGVAEDLTSEIGADPVIHRAWRSHRSLLVRSLDASVDTGLAALFPRARNLILIPLREETVPFGMVVLERPERGDRIAGWTVRMTEQFAAHAGLALRNAWLIADLQRMSETDPLTGAANRRVFQSVLDRELARAARKSETVGLMILDLDHFKQLNDRYGHQAGDDVLRAVADALKGGSRESDLVARYGGEEFAVILPDFAQTGFVAVAERLRRVIAGISAPTRVTASAGLAMFPRDATDAAGLVRAADGALYESKRKGRDCLTVCAGASIASGNGRARVARG